MTACLKQVSTLLLLLCLSSCALAADGLPWYRVELLIFAHNTGAAESAENWAAKPALHYPEHYRLLNSPQQLQQRLALYAQLGKQTSGFNTATAADLPLPAGYYPLGFDAESRVNNNGQQIISILTREAEPQPELATTPAIAASNALPAEPNGPVLVEPQPESTTPQAIPFSLLPSNYLELAGKARSMASTGRYRLLFHGSWLQAMTGRKQAPALVLDASGDNGPWPELQGSITLYLSRYLHLNTNLWLNTRGSYLPPYWRMPTPPRGPRSLVLEESGSALHPGDAIEPNVYTAGDQFSNQSIASSTGSVKSSDDFPGIDQPRDSAQLPVEETESEVSRYPYRHAIALQQKRRMRSGELHYIDHPVFGLVIKFTRMDEQALAAIAEQQQGLAINRAVQP